jgi:LPS-assembly protein
MRARPLLSAAFLLFALIFVCQAQQSVPWVVHGLNPASEWQAEGDTNYFSHGGMVSNSSATVMFDNGTANGLTGEVVAQGDVTILDHGHIWRGTNFIYNFKTGDVRSSTFKSVQGPFQLSGQRLKGSSTNNQYTATNAFITTDDYDHPAYTIRARSITIAVGRYFEAHQATLFWGKTPVFYFPYYKRNLGQHPNNWEFEPGDRGIYGPYLLSAYNWYGNGLLDGTLHMDLRERRGVAGGPDLALHLGNWGEAAFRYYYADDTDVGADGITAPHLQESRQRFQFNYFVQPTSNLTAKVVVNYQSDPLILRDFFEKEYDTNVEPNSFAEVNQLWPNYTLDVLAQPRVVNFFETVERLPDIKLSGGRQQVGETPVFYENESSVGYFKRAFSETNSIFLTTNSFLFPFQAGYRTTNGQPHDYEGSRVDTFHQFTLPENLFGWLNVTPKVGGRLTYYSDVYGPQIHTNDQTRVVFNTGMDVNFKASRIYSGAESGLLDVHELRHIIEPDFDYVYVPAPTRSPSQIPQYDYQSPSIEQLPIDFPENNNIDSIGGMNVVRLTLRNKFQTKREKGIEDLLNFDVSTDYSFHPGTNHPFSDLYSDLDFHPRSWLHFNSSIRYDMASNRWREAVERVIIQPSSAWSLAVSYRYLMNNDPEFESYLGENLPGHNLITGSFYYRMNENWGLHILEQYEAQYGGLQQQEYAIYRDLRSWTAALLFRVTEGPGQPTDFTVALTMSLKAFPRYGVGSDSDPYASAFNSAALMEGPERY